VRITPSAPGEPPVVAVVTVAELRGDRPWTRAEAAYRATRPLWQWSQQATPPVPPAPGATQPDPAERSAPAPRDPPPVDRDDEP
jgi:hypothetical protein